MSSKNTLTKVVIPIAGWGTRMFPASKACPKAFFPLVDPKDGFCKPVLQIIIEEALSLLKENKDGKKIEICIIGQKEQKEQILGYFKGECGEAYKKKKFLEKQIERLSFIGKNIHFVEQKKQHGFGHAILCAKEFVGDDEHFMVMLGDHVYTSKVKGQTCCQQLVKEFYKIGKSTTSLGVCHEDTTDVNGIVGGDVQGSKNKLKLTKNWEKPSKSEAQKNFQSVEFGKSEKGYLCYFGMDILSKKIFKYLEDDYVVICKEGNKRELQLRDGMGALMSDKTEGLYGIRIQGNRHDTGMPYVYAETMDKYLNQ